MHQETNRDNEIIRQLFVEAEDKESIDEKLKKWHAEALANPNVVGIIQRRIDRNSPCWCGSKKLYKKCCWPNKPKTIGDCDDSC